MTFFLITTDHLETCLWFRDDEDFRTGMNLAASVAFRLGIHILAFILMSNHVHFVLECKKEEAMRFITEFKRLLSQHLHLKYGTREMLRRCGIDIQPLRLGGESLERAIAYVQMNCVAANICLNAADYRWGTGNAFFRQTPHKGITLGNLSARARRQALRSKADLPGGWILGEDGYVLPESYVNVKFVESLFQTPRRMNYFLTNSSKARRVLSRAESNLPSFRDQAILAILPDLCYSLFKERNVSSLDEGQLKELADQIRRRFNADPHQIARVVGVSYAEVARWLLDF